MLANIRKLGDNILVRIILIMIALAFVGLGAQGVIQRGGDYDVVSFSRGKNITYSEFLQERAKEVAGLQRQNDLEVSDEAIDNMVLQRLINNNVINRLAEYYDLQISDDLVVKMVMQSPIFKNEKGEFDIQVFKSVFDNSKQREEEYLKTVKAQIKRNTLVSTFLESFPPPVSMVNNIVDYMAEKRNLHLVEIDLNFPNKDVVEDQVPDEKELKEFYENNQALFTIPEKRNIKYIEVLDTSLRKKVKVNEDEKLAFYEENIEDFENKPFTVVQRQVAAALEQRKLEDALFEFVKNLEDEVASGSTLQEIADKYELTLKSKEDVSYEGISEEEGLLSEVADGVFQLAESEVSYPIISKNKNSFILFEVASISPSRVEALAEVLDHAKKLWQEQKVIASNLKTMEQIAKSYNSKALNFKDLEAKGMKVKLHFSLTRDQVNDDLGLPPELLFSIFQVPPGLNTPVIRSGDKAYFAHIESSRTDRAKAEKLMKAAGENIATNIKQAAVEELMVFLMQQDKMVVNQIKKGE